MVASICFAYSMFLVIAILVIVTDPSVLPFPAKGKIALGISTFYGAYFIVLSIGLKRLLAGKRFWLGMALLPGFFAGPIGFLISAYLYYLMHESEWRLAMSGGNPAPRIDEEDTRSPKLARLLLGIFIGYVALQVGGLLNSQFYL